MNDIDSQHHKDYDRVVEPVKQSLLEAHITAKDTKQHLAHRLLRLWDDLSKGDNYNVYLFVDLGQFTKMMK